jgi:hypothetical protein
MFRQIGQCLRQDSLNRCGISLIHIPAQESAPYPEGPDPKTWVGHWSSISDPKLIASQICAANTRQYNQAASTPFASEPLRSYIGQDTMSNGASATLTNTDPPDHILSMLQPETISIIRRLVQPHPTPKQNPSVEITLDAFKSCYKVTPERTSSSPSGRHVGHYKAALHNSSITNLHCQMMSIPFQAGFSPPPGGKKL